MSTDNNDKFGINDKNLKLILETLRSYPQIAKVVVFGSRAMGNFKVGSDIDIALFSKTKIDLPLLAKIKGHLEDEIPTPYLFDLVVYEDIDNINLKNHIDQYGKLLPLYSDPGISHS